MLDSGQWCISFTVPCVFYFCVHQSPFGALQIFIPIIIIILSSTLRELFRKKFDLKSRSNFVGGGGSGVAVKIKSVNNLKNKRKRIFKCNQFYF